MSQQRLQMIESHIAGATADSKASILTPLPSDVVITLSIRTPLTKARKGALKDTPFEGLLIPLLQGVRERSKLDPTLVEEIVVGNVLHKDATWVSRAAAVSAGFPPSVATSTVSRWCSSGLLAVQSVANQISNGCIDIGIAVGAESMSSNPDGGSPEFAQHMLKNSDVQDMTQSMPWTSENVARDFNVTRQEQDAVAARSFQRAERAQKEGWFADEIHPIEVQVKDPKTGKVSTVTADRDDGIRYGTTAESLSKIRSAFPQWPPATTTGGNASQITDGAAAVLLMRRDVAERLGQPILAKFVASTVIGLPPRIMGIGPSIAIPKLLKKVNLSPNDIDIFEINEAFSSMLAYCIKTLELDPEKVNPRGGAIAIGHPLGCSGARQIVTVLSELRRTKKKLAVTSMCVGSGMGMAGLIVNESV